MNNELKPCPFCGGEAQTDFINGGTCRIECYRCDCHTAHLDTPEQAIAAWNCRAALDAAPSEQTAKQQYDAYMEGVEELDPIERLRFFCSLAMSGQDWLDVEPFFDDIRALKDEQPATTAAGQHDVWDQIANSFDKVAKECRQPMYKDSPTAAAHQSESKTAEQLTSGNWPEDAKHENGNYWWQWPEDAKHENGNYWWQWHQCGKSFIGHKRGVTCKICASKTAEQAQSGKPDVLDKLLACVDDPMWADHVEMRKDFIHCVIDEVIWLRTQVAAQPVVPQGFVLVPIEPTKKMASEGGCASYLPGPHYIGEKAALQCWQYMIAAALQGDAQ